MSVKTIEQLHEEIADLESALEAAEKDLNEAQDEAMDLEKELADSKDEVEELTERVEELEAQNLDITTCIGKMDYTCDNQRDEDTMELVCELMLKKQPAILQEQLKALLL